MTHSLRHAAPSRARRAALLASSLLAVAAPPRPATAQWAVPDNSGSAFAQSAFPGGGWLPAVRDERFFGPNGGAAVAEVNLSPWGRMRGVQLGNGLNAVAVEGRASDISFFDFSAGTDIDVTVQNIGPFIESLVFDYHINGGELRLYDPSNLFDGVHASVSVSIFAISPGFSGFVWSWDLSLRGSRGVVAPQVDFFIDPLGFGQPALGAVTMSPGEASIQIAPFSASVELGPLSPGGTAFVTYDMDAQVSGLGYNETGGLARLGDPFGLSGDPGAGIAFRGVDLQAAPTAVPEPATLSLAALGLAALGLAAPGLRRAGRRGR